MTSSLTGTGTLLRFALRRDRVRLAVWIGALGSLVGFSAASIVALYPDGEGLAEYAATVEVNPALAAIAGPAHALDTMGGRVVWELWFFGVAVAFLAALTVVRHTRTEEETGRTELVRSGVVGRHAQAAAALGVATLASLAVGVVVVISLLALGLEVAGSLLVGASFVTVGLAFAGVGLLAAQVTEHARTASGIATAAIGLAFVLRAAGDAGNGVLSWFSPLGWQQATQPYSDERWWVLLLPVVAAAGSVAVAVVLEGRRDEGAGLVAPRPGPAEAPASLGSALGLAWRLQRGGLLGWTVGVFLFGLAMGSVANTADDLVGDNQQVLDYLAQLDADLVDIFLATIVTYLALLGVGYAVSSALRARSEETAGRAEALLATALDRPRWGGSHLVLALGGSVVVLAAAGLGAGLAHGIAVGDAGQVPRMTGAALAYLPAVWCFAALGAALTGAAPRVVATAWGLLGYAVVIAVFGDVLDLPGWVRGVSPLHHVPLAPVEVPGLPVTAALVATTVALVTVGLVTLARRDLATT